ncbi:DUF397 domain-containing protein [Streptomyces lancefieldiae]|uniref:DUF397 domain-containing protein n=1 Tax=Streptomyces lancefieldiae TaxID=3075520 RepID=A0ABU3AYH6_9ACTN|nr:DUF397 domain-containing protein [Streptomyces sp. DSM 40712]MDT0613861.1 DUF397 domain-containing protein [Streptomyces sp. DSM 40712]
MSESTWQKSSYCGEGDSCLHVAATPTGVHLTESSDPTRSILTATPTAFGALLAALKSSTRPEPIQVTFAHGADADAPVRIHGTDTPGAVVTTDRQKWEAFVLGVKAGEFDHFAEEPDEATTGQIAPQPHCST